jgi:hypothetical protein
MAVRRGDKASYLVLPCPITLQWVAVPFPGGGGAKPPGLDISCSVYHLGTCVTESYMEKHAFTRVCLFYIRVTMVIMCVFMVELLCQTSMG